VKHVTADVQWALHRAWQIAQKKLLTPYRRLPSDVPPSVPDVAIERDVWVPMSDGVRLLADVYLPAGPDVAAPFPTILIRMPYGKTEAYCYMPSHGKYWARRGYACVIQDVRGRWGSEGVYEPFVNEAKDGYDTLDWVAAQPWCDGNVGMTGESYYGYTQWAVATLGHPNLKCIAPGDTAADIYASWIYNDNAFCLSTMGGWAYVINGKQDYNEFRFDPWHLPLAEIPAAAGHESKAYSEWMEHQARDEYWDRVNVCHRYADVKVPALHWGGWYDVFLNGTLGGWQGVRDQGAEEVRDKQWLMIGATDHELSPEFTGHIGKLAVERHGYAHDRIKRFMDHWLRGEDAGVSAGGQVLYFTMGKNEWRRTDEWPPKQVEYRRYYLHSDGRAATLEGDGALRADAPSDDPPDRFTYDPRDPVRYWLGSNMWELAKHMGDRREVERRGDVIVYTTEPLSSDLEVTGPLSVTLSAATSARDTDFTAALVDVHPDGYAHLVQEGIRRARFRESDARESQVEPGAVDTYEVDLWATSYVFAAGHRIRLEVSSSNFDRYDRNLNTGRFAFDDEIVVAEQTVYHSSEHPSFVTLPVMPGA
jgi:putative CocE/NonD family hydrolase